MLLHWLVWPFITIITHCADARWHSARNSHGNAELVEDTFSHPRDICLKAAVVLHYSCTVFNERPITAASL